jgi:transposase
MMRIMLTDAQWAVLEPLIEACRPHCKTQHHHLRRTMEAIIWRCQNGAKWRAVPAEYGPWWMAAQTFIRWGGHGVWERLLSLVQEQGVRLGIGLPRWQQHPCASEGRRCGQKGGSGSPTRYA